MPSLKQAIHEIADQLPERATWDDVLYTCYIRQKLDEGVRDLDAGRSYTQEEVEKRLLGKQS